MLHFCRVFPGQKFVHFSYFKVIELIKDAKENNKDISFELID